MLKKILDIAAVICSIDDIDRARLAALEMLREILWFDRANFWLYDPLTGVPQGPPVSLELTLDNHNYYFKYFARTDEVRQAYRDANVLIARSTDLLSYSSWTNKSAYYHDMFKPLSIYYSLGLELKDRNTAFGGLCFFRSASTGDFHKQDIDTLNHLYPHFLNRLRWHSIINSKSPCQPRLQDGIICNNHLFEQLTEREREVVKLTISGSTNQEIAYTLGISLNTVKMHLQNIFTKLEIKRRSQMAVLYLSTNAPGKTRL